MAAHFDEGAVAGAAQTMASGVISIIGGSAVSEAITMQSHEETHFAADAEGEPATASVEDPLSSPSSPATSDETQKTTATFTEFATSLNTAFERFHLDDTMRPTIIHPASQHWQKTSQTSLIQSTKKDGSHRKTEALSTQDLLTAKRDAFRLLDALTRSGGLAIEHADLHLLVTSTHRFDKSLMQTLVEDSVNPIERVEKSVVVMAATLYGERNITGLLRQGAAGLIGTNADIMQLE